MKLGKALFTRLGLYSRKSDGPDLFDLRLERIGVRERRCTSRRGVFRTMSTHPAV